MCRGGFFFVVMYVKIIVKNYCKIKNKYYICTCQFRAGASAFMMGGIGRHI